MSQAGGNGRHRMRTESPRRVRKGVRLKSREGPQAGTWVAVRWLKLLEFTIDEAQRDEGLEYARSGQTISLEVLSGGVIEARVQGRLPKAYTTQIRLPALSDAQWHELILSMAGEAMYAAKLLAGDMPAALDDLFESMGLHLLPLRPGAVTVECTCDVSRGGRPCKHAAAVGYLFADRLSEEPALLFDVYGMSNQRVIERLRQARAVQAQGGASGQGAHTAVLSGALIPEAQVEPPPMETCLDDFWRCGPQLVELEHAPPPQHVAHALLRRLGPSPMKGKFPLVGLLASIYDEVADAAISIRNRAERVE